MKTYEISNLRQFTLALCNLYTPHYSFSRSKYFQLLIALIEGFIDRKIDVTTMQFLLA